MYIYVYIYIHTHPVRSDLIFHAVTEEIFQ